MNENGLAVSTTSLSELAWLAAAGKLRFDPPVEFSRKDREGESCSIVRPENHFGRRDVSSAFPRNPAERQIAATAIVHNLKLVIADDAILKSG